MLIAINVIHNRVREKNSRKKKQWLDCWSIFFWFFTKRNEKKKIEKEQKKKLFESVCAIEVWKHIANGMEWHRILRIIKQAKQKQKTFPTKTYVHAPRIALHSGLRYPVSIKMYICIHNWTICMVMPPPPMFDGEKNNAIGLRRNEYFRGFFSSLIRFDSFRYGNLFFLFGISILRVFFSRYSLLLSNALLLQTKRKKPKQMSMHCKIPTFKIHVLSAALFEVKCNTIVVLFV